ncbi:MAG: ParB/RepB/Spo0J family partition protein [Alphaproteobacteria bacterium]|nr:ParB/RepB/Spo0J family partition protein [Alphaproteobacteria bacterium]
MSDDENLKPGAEGASEPKTRRRGLGRGLDALFEDDEGVYPQPDSNGHTPGRQRRVVGLGQLEPNPKQPRRNFDDTALAELAESIRRHGILQPLVVRAKEGFPDIYQIIAGERRWRAAQAAQVHDVPVVVMELEDEAVLEIALVENLQREDLNPLEEAEGYKRLVDQHNRTQEEIARAVGKSRSHVANMMRLLNLPAGVRKMVSVGELSSGHARALVTATDPEGLAREIVARGLNVRQTEALAGEAAGREPSTKSVGVKAAPEKDADTRALEDEISNVLGMRVTIAMKGKGAGKLTVDFQNLDQLDEVLHRLSHYPGSRVHG